VTDSSWFAKVVAVDFATDDDDGADGEDDYDNDDDDDDDADDDDDNYDGDAERCVRVQTATLSDEID